MKTETTQSVPLVINVQRYAIHDGAGIRATVFFKGCPLRCAWCHNPESQSFSPEWMRYPERCIGCGHCDDDVCPAGARERIGTAYTEDALAALLMRDRMFYDVSGGGVTLSGGEVMAQEPTYILALVRRLHRFGIRVAIDTCGHVPYARFAALLPYVDVFLYDLKAMDAEVHERYTGVDNRLILENLRRLSRDSARINLRVPVIPGVNESDEAMGVMIAFVREHACVFQVNLLPYHRLGQEKRERLGGGEAPVEEAAPLFEEPASASMEALAARWRNTGFDAVVIGG